MAVPILLSTYPSDGSTGIPIGQPIVLTFDKSIDVTSIKDYVVLYGSDFDQTSGPESVLWVDKDTGNNPFFLKSPGFKGLVDLKATIVYYDLDTDEDITSPTFVSEIDEASYGAAGAGHRVYLTPVAGHLAADTEYVLHILGDPDTLNTGISSRTVFDTEPDVGNTSDTGLVYCSGGYTGSISDTVVIEITTGGDIGTAKYKWYLESAGSSSSVYNKLSNRQYRSLSNGVLIRFSGEGFAVGDVYRINLEPPQRLSANYKVTFTTNDGTYTTAPDSPSTPATSEPPENVIPPAPGVSTSGDYLQVEEMIPGDGAYNVALKNNTITILFSDLLEPSTISDDSVRVYKYPVLGWFEGQAEPIELAKKLTLSGQVLQIEI